MTDKNQTTRSASGSITLRTVADAAGVSVSTASRALNGQARRYRISETTEQKIREVADRLGFQPSQVARSLRLQRSELIGVVVPDISNPFFAEIAREVSLGAEAGGFSVLLGDSREDTEIEKRLVNQLKARQVEALLVCPVGVESDHLIELEAKGLPVVVVDRAFDDVNLVSVTSNNLEAAEEIAELLIRMGHETVGVIMGVPESLPARQRLEGLKRAMEKSGLQLDPDRIVGSSFTENSGYVSAKEIMQRFPDTTSLFAMCTTGAIGAMRALKEMGYSVPEDVSIVTFDDHSFTELMETPLTTSAQNVSGLGRTATEILIHRLKTKSIPEHRTYLVDNQLREKASVAKPRQIGHDVKRLAD